MFLLLEKLNNFLLALIINLFELFFLFLILLCFGVDLFDVVIGLARFDDFNSLLSFFYNGFGVILLLLSLELSQLQGL